VKNKKFKSILYEIENKMDKYITIFEIKYPHDKFKKEVGTPTKFLKKLSNSKMKLSGFPSNREWWKHHNPNGIHRYKIDDDGTITIKYVMETNNLINPNELKLRIYKILRPIEINIYPNDFDYLVENIETIFEDVKEGVKTFGGLKKNELNDFHTLFNIFTDEENSLT